jgi:glycosyltransferase involved in cell wall biosynthesis
MPRILRIINRLNLGGPTYNVAYLSKYLAPEFETLLVSGVKEDSEESSEFILRELGVEVTYIPEMHRSIHPWKDLAAYRKIRRLIKEFRPDIVHTHAAKAGTVGRMAAYGHVPVVVHTFHGHVFHSYFTPLKTRVFLEIERYLARKSSAIIAISEKQKEELAFQYRVCEPSRIAVIPLGFNLERFTMQQELKRKQFRERYHLADDEIAIGIVGRLVPVKNHSLFIRAFRELQQLTSLKIKAFIIGDGESRAAAEECARSLGLAFSAGGENHTAPLVFTSWIKEVDMVYAGLDIVALTSLNEGTPVSLIEAQAAGKPIVSTNVGGIENIVQQGITALLSDNTLESFSGRLLELVQNEGLRHSMALAGRERVLQQFSYKRLTDDTRALYHRLLAAQQRSLR